MSHNQPDLIISTYKELGQNPWTELNQFLSSIQEQVAEFQMGWFSGSLAGLLGGGQETPEPATSENISQNPSTYNFREVDAIGYPFPFEVQGLGELFCPSQARPFMPHYSSAFDAFAWRFGLLEIIYLPKIFTEAIGIPYFMEWGSVYPRIASAHQKEDAKMSALAAQRGADIVTRNGPHVSNSLVGEPSGLMGSFRIFSFPDAVELEKNNHAWQMFSPIKESSCKRFDPIAESFVSTENWLVGRDSGDGSSVYALWRGRYECCVDRGGVYLGTIKAEACL